MSGEIPVVTDPSRSLNPLRIRQQLGRREWGVPRPFGDGWGFLDRAAEREILVTNAKWDDVDWVHASIAYRDVHVMPTYDDLKTLHRGVFDDGWAYQVFTPAAAHVNIRGNALHLWGRLDGAPVLPDFAAPFNSI